MIHTKSAMCFYLLELLVGLLSSTITSYRIKIHYSSVLQYKKSIINKHLNEETSLVIKRNNKNNNMF